MHKTALLITTAITCLCMTACTQIKTLGPEMPSPTPTVSLPQWVGLPAGTFVQDDSYNSFTHTISSFNISNREISYEYWYSVYTWALAHGYVFEYPGREGNSGVDAAKPTMARHQPVTTICWRDAIVWCNALSRMNGLKPVYCQDAAFNFPIMRSSDPAYAGSINTMGGSSDNPYVNWAGNGIRLPTEGEWQYAARYIDGSSWLPVNYASGAAADCTDLTATAAVAWFIDDSGFTTHDTGLKLPNASGLYDMSGNIAEFCWDWYGSYPASPQVDYRGPATDTIRVIVGGGYYASAIMMEVCSKGGSNPWQANSLAGFRIAESNP